MIIWFLYVFSLSHYKKQQIRVRFCLNNSAEMLWEKSKLQSNFYFNSYNVGSLFMITTIIIISQER